MSSRKEKLTLKNWSAVNIAVLCWFGRILVGDMIRLACNTVNFMTLLEDCTTLAVLFLIQLVAAIILGKCYAETTSVIHRKILIGLGAFHSGLMLWDMSLLIWLTDISLRGCFILSVTLFLLTGIICRLSDELTALYGKGFDRSTLYKFVRFYRFFPQIVDSASPQLERLSWTHFRVLLQVNDEAAREWYAAEAVAEAWSVKTLQRNISSQYYYRLLQTRNPDAVKAEMETLTADYQTDKLEFIKNPVITEILGMSPVCDYLESQLETCIINNLQKFLMELGKGYAFVARQKRIVTEKNTYLIDLVFYNYILKCFVLIDLKTSAITHQDVGQMDMYIRMYDEKIRGEDDNPTLGILLCADTDEDIARYSVMHGSEQLFASKYLLYLPSKEELRAEIENQKMMFYLQHNSDK